MVEKDPAEAEFNEDGGFVPGGGLRLGHTVTTLNELSLTVAQTVRSLDMVLDTSFSMEAQVINVAKLTFFYLHHTRQLTLFLPHPDLVTVIYAMVTCRQNSCNLLYIGLPLIGHINSS